MANGWLKQYKQHKKIHTTQKVSKENYMMQHNNANLYIKFSCLLSDNIISSIQCTCTLKIILYTIAQIQSVFYKKKCPLG